MQGGCAKEHDALTASVASLPASEGIQGSLDRGDLGPVEVRKDWHKWERWGPGAESRKPCLMNTCITRNALTIQ